MPDGYEDMSLSERYEILQERADSRAVHATDQRHKEYTQLLGHALEAVPVGREQWNAERFGYDTVRGWYSDQNNYWAGEFCTARRVVKLIEVYK